MQVKNEYRYPYEYIVKDPKFSHRLFSKDSADQDQTGPR